MTDERKPNLGDIVIYRVSDTEKLSNNHQDYAPAIVTGVFSDGLANLSVILDGTERLWRISAQYGTDVQQWRWPHAPRP